MRMDNMHERQDNTAENELYCIEIGIKALDELAKENNGMAYFINSCAETIAKQCTDEFKQLTTLSSYIASVFGGMSDLEEKQDIWKAFLKGAITGVCLTDVAYDNAVGIKDTFDVIEAERSQYEDYTAFYMQHGPRLIDTARQGEERLFGGRETIENWEYACVQDIRYHHFYRMGLGVYVGHSAKALLSLQKMTDLKQMSEQLETGSIDWDKEFTMLDEGNI